MTAAKTTRHPKRRPELSVGGLPRKPDTCAVDASRARITICAPFVDRRFAPAPDHVGEFSREGIGRYVETKEP